MGDWRRVGRLPRGRQVVNWPRRTRYEGPGPRPFGSLGWDLRTPRLLTGSKNPSTTENEERKRGSFNLTLLEELKASADFSRDLRGRLPNRELDSAIQLHLEGIAILQDDVAVKLEGLRAGKTYDEA